MMTYTEKKRSMFLGLPWTFTSYTVTDEIITINNGLLRKEENDCYLYKVIDVEYSAGAYAGTRHHSLLYRRCYRPGSQTVSYQTFQRNQGLYPETVWGRADEKKNIKHAASGRQSSHEPNGRDRQLQIKSHSKGQVCYRPVLFAYNWLLFICWEIFS